MVRGQLGTFHEWNHDRVVEAAEAEEAEADEVEEAVAIAEVSSTITWT